MNKTSNNNLTLRSMGCDSAAATSKQVCSSCGASSQSTSVARYNDEGNCASTTGISCETKWQMRDCLKLGLCEFLVCVANEFCVNGKFQMPVDESGEEKGLGDVLTDCMGGALCSVAHCLPNAICGPKQNNDCIPPPPALECNFAVEEKD